MKIKVFIFAFNRPDLLHYQIQCIKKFMKGDISIQVIHDTKGNHSEIFDGICAYNAIPLLHYTLKEKDKSPSYRHSSIVQHAYDTLMIPECSEDYCLLLDHDMFLIEEFDLNEYMDGYDVAGCLQERDGVKYLWPGLTIFDMRKVKLIPFTMFPGLYENKLLDTGGGTYSLLKSKRVKYKDTEVEYPTEYNDVDLLNEDVFKGYNFELHLDRKFLHFRNASCWHNDIVDDQKKTQVLRDLLSDFIEV